MADLTDTERDKAPDVPQYEEYRSAGWLATVCQWFGGLALAVMGVLRWLFPEIADEPGTGGRVLTAVFLACFLIPAIRSRSRSRENQAISRRNRERYNRYRSELEQH